MRSEGSPLLALLAFTQAIAAVRVVIRLARTANGRRIEASDEVSRDSLAVIVPVLNEVDRLGPCLEGLGAQPGTVREIIVVDGGSTDGTQALVEAFAVRDQRIRLVDAAPVPAGWNGKAWGLVVGRRHLDPAVRWVLTIDADVRPAPGLAAALLAHARREGVGALSVATAQALSGPAEALLHPAMLTTLVYRYGIPGHRVVASDAVQANGQCFLLQTDVLDRAGGFASGRNSVCEDVTLARSVADAGELVGFYEAPGLIAAAMYAGWQDAWRNWPRSLPMRDRFAGRGWWVRMVEVTLAQGLPLPMLAVAGTRRGRAWRLLRLVNLVLLLTRLGTLAGTRRAYLTAPPTYWLSPLTDPLVVAALWRGALRRRH
ncbi:MAG: glycosyltransferase, partial [Chloroflexia bacterium]|nr:glycosyltransferase [Chloroflexia bacterium]